MANSHNTPPMADNNAIQRMANDYIKHKVANKNKKTTHNKDSQTVANSNKEDIVARIY